MSVVEAFDPNEIRLSDNAVSKVRALVEDEGNPGLKLRVYITGGGCSGFQYGFSFDEAVSEDDMVVERDGVTALIDAMSYQYLVGSESGSEDSSTRTGNIVVPPPQPSTI